MIANVRFPKYALRFDGVNDYLISNAGTPITQWEYTQPFTFFWKYQDLNIFTGTRRGSVTIAYSPTLFRGIAIGRTEASGFGLVLTNTTGSNTFYVRVGLGGLPSTGTIQVTYNGTPNNINSVDYYVNGVLYTTSKTLVAANLTSTIIDPIYPRYVYVFPFNASYRPSGLLFETSFVNYAKSPAEIAADYAAGTQSAGSGSFLLNVKPIYPDFITSLNPTVPFLETAQNTQVGIVGKTNPMLFGTDLVALPNTVGNSKYYKINLRP